MPSKAEFYRQMAEQVSTRLVGSWKEWTAFSRLPPASTNIRSMNR